MLKVHFEQVDDIGEVPVGYEPSTGERLLIPPAPYWLAEEVELTARLHSTRSGLGARWEGSVPPDCRNRAPRNPLLRAIIAGFHWSPPNTKDCPARVNPPTWAEWWIHQTGSAVPNWAGQIIRPLEDPDRQVLEELRRRDLAKAGSQGRLEVFALGHEPLVEALSLRTKSGNRWFFNHLLHGNKGFTYRVLGEAAVAVVRGPVLILSPDHPRDPLLLTGQCYLLLHPFPSGTDGAD